MGCGDAGLWTEMSKRVMNDFFLKRVAFLVQTIRWCNHVYRYYTVYVYNVVIHPSLQAISKGNIFGIGMTSLPVTGTRRLIIL